MKVAGVYPAELVRTGAQVGVAVGGCCSGISQLKCSISDLQAFQVHDAKCK